MSRSNQGPRMMFGLAAGLAALAVAPTTASAANTWFGSRLNHEPANAGNTCADFGLMGPAMCTHVGSFYPGTSGRAAAPVNGVITKIKVRAQGPAKMTFKLVKVRRLAANHEKGQAQAVVKSRTVQVHGPSAADQNNGVFPVESFKVHLKVKRGEMLAVDTTSNTAEYCADGTPGQLLFDPKLAVGAGFRNSGGVDDCLMLVQGVIKH
jgi:hypothetical protein